MQAAKQLKHIEWAILDALNQIPDAIKRAEAYTRLYKEDFKPKALTEKTCSLLRAIMRGLTHILNYSATSSLRELSIHL
jgi:hypothetical protein